MNKNFLNRHVVMMSALALLVSCGGGSDGGSSTSSGSPTGTTGGTRIDDGGATVAVGTVTGFGSVIVDGVRFNDSAATVEVETEPGAPVSIRSRDLKIGQTATVTFTGNESNANAQSIRIEGEIVGSVDSVDAAGGKLVVSGQDVRTNVDATKGRVTVFDGFQSLADVKVGDRIEVHGTPQVDAVTKAIFVQATRIELKADAKPFVRLTGTIAGLAANTFELGAMKISFAGTTRIIPANVTLANGQRVAVWSDMPANANTLTAKVIRVKGEMKAGGVRIGGPITDCAAACIASFKVNGLSIDASAAKFDNGTAATLVNGVYVRIRGVLDAATGKVIASKVEFRGQDELELDVRGTISGFTAGANGTAAFSVRGVPVQTNAQTKTSGCASALADGVPVKVEGTVAGNVMLATEVKCLPSLDSLKVEVRGAISVADAAAKTFKLASMPDLTIAFDPATTKFDDGTAAQLVVGAFVEVEGAVANGKLTATEIEFKRAPGANERSIKGLVFMFNATAGTFKVGALTITVGSAALPAGFADGVRVEVDFTTANGVNTATSIKLAK
ncbi:MAG: DUF5666 domain-containing protein [Burkholderiales bacterium]